MSSDSPNPTHIQENLIAYMRLFAGLPGMYMHDTGSFWFVSNRPAPGDAILRTRWPDRHVDERIDELLEEIGRYVDQVGWMVFPGDQPANLGQRLNARGMPGGPGGNWLWADLAAPEPVTYPAAADRFRVVQVNSDAMLTEWVRISEAGFEEELGCFYDAYARHGYGSQAFSIHYIGYLEDTPVTSATLLDAGGSAAIYDVSTPAGLRHQGYGGTITHFLMQEIRRRGYTNTWIWSSNMARSLYQRLGFIDIDFGMREYTWQKRNSPEA